MRKVLLALYIILGITLLLKPELSKASHAAGGELIYEWVSDSTYRFYFKFYRDCNGSSETNTQSMSYVNTCTNQTYTATLTKMGTLPGNIANGTPVSPGCPSFPTKCLSSTSTIPGYREWWYSALVTLPARCSQWKFSVTVSVRNSSMNIVGTPTFYVEATLNNLVAQGNSSPYFSVKPVPYLCINEPYAFNNGGVDANGDSLAFTNIIPLQSAGTNCPLQSKTPSLSVSNNPFQTGNTFSINGATGQINFTPTEQGAQTITVIASEYRNGVLIGSVMRDIQIQVLSCSSTQMHANPKTSTFVNSQLVNGQIRACAGRNLAFCFDAATSDTSKKLVVSDNHTAAAPGSTVSYTGQYDDSIRGCFSWTPALSDTGLKVFTVTVKDSTCLPPGIMFSQTFVIPIYITPSVKGYNDTTICLGDTANLSAVGGTVFTWTVLSGSPGSLSCTNCANPRAYPTVTTAYRVFSNIPSACVDDTVVVTIANNATVSASSNTPVCIGDTLKLFASNVSIATGYSWTGPNGFTSSLQNPVLLNAQTINGGRYYARFLVNTGSHTCTSDTAGTTVIVDIPAKPTASSNSPVCLNDTIRLYASSVAGATGYAWTGPNGFTSSLQNPKVPNSILASAGVYTVWAFRNTCSSLPDSTSITITAIPAPVASGPLTYCQSVTAVPLTATGSNLKWYTTLTGGTGVTSLTPSTATAGVFKYYVSQTVGGCEGYRDSVTVTILPKPALPVVTNVSYCLNETATQVVASGTNLRWYTTATGGTGSSTAPTPVTTTAGTFIFYVTQTDTNGCESDRAPLSVVIKPLPSAPIVFTPANYCQLEPVSPAITAYVTGASILWYTTATGGVGSATPPTISTATPGSSNYWVSQTVNGCEGSRAQLTVVVNPKPTTPGVLPIAYCQNDVAVPLTATGTNLKWYTTSTGGTGSTSAPTPSTLIAGTFYYYVSQTVNGCESYRDSVRVTIKPQPAPPFAVQTTYCQFQSANPISTVSGSNLLWYAAATGGTGSPTAPTPSTLVAGTQSFWVTQTVNGCESNRAQVDVITIPKPNPPVVSSPVKYCINIPANPLTATGTNLKWYTVPTGGFGSPGPMIPSTASIGTVSYYVSQTVNTCESDRAQIDVIIDTLTDATISFSKNPVCQYDSLDISYQGGVPVDGTFTWTFDGGDILNGSNSGPYKIKWEIPGTKTITLYAIKKGCRARDNKQVEVLPAPLAHFQLPLEICRDKELEVTPDNNLYLAKKYIWTSDGDAPGGNENRSYIVKWATSGTKSITLHTISADGCISKPYTATTLVRADPDAEISYVSDNSVCKGDTITLKAKEVYSYTYQWSPEDLYLNSTSALEVQAVVFNNILVLTATDTVGCSANDTALINVQPCCQLALPSAFSPNKDGRNDIFRALTVGHQTILSFIILNRFGQVVYSTTDQKQGWDGTFKGVDQDLGTYYYYVKYRCSDDNVYEKKGDVTLVR